MVTEIHIRSPLPLSVPPPLDHPNRGSQVLVEWSLASTWLKAAIAGSRMVSPGRNRQSEWSHVTWSSSHIGTKRWLKLSLMTCYLTQHIWNVSNPHINTFKCFTSFQNPRCVFNSACLSSNKPPFECIKLHVSGHHNKTEITEARILPNHSQKLCPHCIISSEKCTLWWGMKFSLKRPSRPLPPGTSPSPAPEWLPRPYLLPPPF